MPACLVGELTEQATVRLFQHDFLQLFKPRSVVRSKVELVGFHQTEISDDKQFAFHDLERSHAILADHNGNLPTRSACTQLSAACLTSGFFVCATRVAAMQDHRHDW
jgi:hypothetical protein